MSAASKGRPKSAQMRARLSDATKGKPKPWHQGENNPNFGNKAQGTPEARERFLAASKARGQAWTAEDRQRHSDTMRGPSNKMRGRHHTAESIAKIAAAKTQQYCEGTVKTRRYKLSAAERAIAEHLTAKGVLFETQYHIKGVPYLYDFYFPSTNTLLEYQGDYWHANPTKYPRGTTLSIQNMGRVLVDDIWARDDAKRKAAEELGFRVVYVWEAEYKALGFEALCPVIP